MKIKKAMEIKKGDKFLCIKTVRMNSVSGEVAYRQGEVYESEHDGCITDLQGTKYHYWSGIDENSGKVSTYFVPLEEETLYDEYGEELIISHKVVCKVADNVILKGKVKDYDPDVPSVEVEVAWPNGDLRQYKLYHYGKRDGKVCMSEIVNI